MAAIGFLASRDNKPALSVQERPPSEQLLRFDQNSAIHFDEAAHNTLVLGSTGSGKTSSAILPACRQLFKAGFAGLVIDIKGNLTEQIRRIAADCGRAKDVVEFGTSRTARRVNILADLSSKEAYEFFKTLGSTMYQTDDHNTYWHLQGIKIAADVLEALRAVKAHLKGHCEVPADIFAVNEVLNNPALALKVFECFKTIHDTSNPTHKRLVNKVDGDAFHIFTREDKSAEYYAAQTSWRLAAIRNALDLFAETPGLENFSALAKGIDIKRLIYVNRKIVVISFDAAGGEIARALSRHLIETYYKAVLKRGLGLPDGQYTFLLADEFQDSASFDSANRWNDNVFTAKSREFRSIQMFASQSLSSLMSRGASLPQVEEFLNNCNNRLFFYCDDSQTQQAVARFDEGIHLPKLDPGQCFTSRYDLSSRKHISGLERLQTAHDAIKVLLSSTVAPSNPKARKNQKRASLEELFEKITSPPKKEQMASLSPTRLYSEKERSEDVVLFAEEDKQPPFIRRRPRSGQKKAQEWVANQKREQEKLESAAAKAAFPEHILTLVEKYPAFFPPACYKDIEIPVGWVKPVEKAIERVIDAAGGKVTELNIESWTTERFCQCGIYVCYKKESIFAAILNKLLVIIRFCPVCGLPALDRGFLCEKCYVENSFFIDTDPSKIAR